jgi:hypothetical protein
MSREDEPEDGGACTRGSSAKGSGAPMVEGPGALGARGFKSSIAASNQQYLLDL